ncbi:hypothetical protein P3X46_025335 [Hevea brasiliensis]|uniref:Fungal lipase-type domain-containing protein n=1 Tax=Hevea brasiliensis TaxID=3981 RepID=A0ABQ9L582_HEVBR|nr:hypothetical protein P3X46_025335 [Hevea brasiliensis]
MGFITPTPRRLIVNHHRARVWFLLNFIFFEDRRIVFSFFDCSYKTLTTIEVINNYCLLLLSWFLQVLLDLIDKPLMYLGYVVEFYLNLLSQNGGFLGLFMNIFLGKLKKPERGTENFLSTIGGLDPRVDLRVTGSFTKQLNEKAIAEMNFVGYYNCWNGRRIWNEKRKACNTQAFILSDKPRDANLIVISFRGSEPFNSQDWMTSIDFSWFEVPNVGKLHVGYLECMGIGTRSDASSFESHLQKRDKNFFQLDAESEKESLRKANKSAYYLVAIKLSNLLKENPNAKFVVTGHSLGGALAIIFPTLLAIQDEVEMLQRLLGVYTFGQPRIGDVQLGKFMEPHLHNPVTKYFRVVYSDDIVPRLPFNGKAFHYKHFGECIYYDRQYLGQFKEDVPNPNYFDMKYIFPMRLRAVLELMRSLKEDFTPGSEYKETTLCKGLRLMGLLLPGIASHNPVNYVNCVRLGREKAARLTSITLS